MRLPPLTALEAAVLSEFSPFESLCVQDLAVFVKIPRDIRISLSRMPGWLKGLLLRRKPGRLALEIALANLEDRKLVQRISPRRPGVFGKLAIFLPLEQSRPDRRYYLLTLSGMDMLWHFQRT